MVGEFRLVRPGEGCAGSDVPGGAWERGDGRQSHLHRASWWALPPGGAPGTGVLPLDMAEVWLHLCPLLAGGLRSTPGAGRMGVFPHLSIFRGAEDSGTGPPPHRPRQREGCGQPLHLLYIVARSSEISPTLSATCFGNRLLQRGLTDDFSWLPLPCRPVTGPRSASSSSSELGCLTRGHSSCPAEGPQLPSLSHALLALG